ncbi:MAG: DUF4279 domain-containing protein [Firmicutes bacterium]|nr:DUF4279 domain-containing protein [Bacillota bacterium]
MSQEIMIEFAVIGDFFPLEVISERLGLMPTDQYYKGDKIPELKNQLTLTKETCWSLSTGYQQASVANEQLDDILRNLYDKKEILNELSSEYNLTYKIFVVFRTEDSNSGLIIDSPVIDFAHSIGASFDIDIYG